MEKQMKMSEKAAGKQPIPRPTPLDGNALTEMLADPNRSPGPDTTDSIKRLAAKPADHKKPVGTHTTHTIREDFLKRDFHSVRANRFLFSCADEYDGCAANRMLAWKYKLP